MNLEPEISKFDPKLADYLRDHQYQPEKILSLHKTVRKGTITLLVSRASEKYVMKYYDARVDVATQQQCLREREFYKQRPKNDLLPQVQSISSKVLLLKYIDGSTLTQWLTLYRKLSGSDEMTENFKYLFQRLFSGMEGLFITEAAKPWSEEDLNKPLIERFTKLMLSGYQHVKKNPFLSVSNALLEKVMKRKLHGRIRQIVHTLHEKQIDLRQGEMHYDLHCDNIIVSKDVQPVIADFETLERGFLIVDLLYLLTMCCSMLGSLQNHRDFLYKEVCKRFIAPDLQEDFARLFELFQDAVSINPAFRYKPRMKDIFRGYLRLLK